MLLTAAYRADISALPGKSLAQDSMTDANQTVLTISEVNRLARLAIEKQLPSCWIRGEISNLTRASSGHWYFTLKDASASARCVMFRTRNQFVDWAVAEGHQIEIRAQASLYEPRGDFQLIVEAMRKAGQGQLFERFLQLKEKLQQEGLFNPERKKTLPAHPRSIGIITSPTGAALRDVITTLRRRWPLTSTIIYPTQVQGETAPYGIQQAIRAANQRNEVELLLLVRGGGSLEDLWAFNDEQLARTIAASFIPIISGVGHETDFTIADFVADMRAPTPTGAAQLATPDAVEAVRHVIQLASHLSRRFRSGLDTAWQHRDHLIRRLRHPHERLSLQRLHLNQLWRRALHSGKRSLDAGYIRVEYIVKRLLRARPAPASHNESLTRLEQRMHQHMRHQQTLRNGQVASLRTQLGMLCPNLVLERGYSIVRSKEGKVIASAQHVQIGQPLSIELAQGHLDATVLDKSR